MNTKSTSLQAPLASDSTKKHQRRDGKASAAVVKSISGGGEFDCPRYQI